MDLRSLLATFLPLFCIVTVVKAEDLPSDCGVGGNTRVKRIEGGVESQYGDWPWLVGIRYNSHYQRDEGEGEVTLMCSGSIINKQFILTTTGCTDFDDPFTKVKSSSDPGDYTIRLGDHNRTIEEEHEFEAKISNIYNYPGTEFMEALSHSKPLYSSYSLLKLTEPLPEDHEFVRPICLPTQKWAPVVGTFLTAVGWGITEEGGPESDVIREVELPVISNEECEETISPIMTRMFRKPDWTLPPDVFCAGSDEKDACQHDAASPLMEKVNDRWYLRSMVVYSYGCKPGRKYGLYPRVDLVLPWIKKIIAEES